MKIKQFEYVAAGHDLSHWNSTWAKSCVFVMGFLSCPEH